MRAFTILCLLLVATKFGMSLAHVLELPGKLRLDEATYKAVQAIYYPGFTIAGFIGEFGGIVALAVLLYLTPYGTSRFWWTAAALALLVAGHATYWLVTHPVNNFWVKDIAMSAPGSTFFSMFAGGGRNGHWTELRNLWEFSHVVIACFATLSLISIGITTSLLPKEPPSCSRPAFRTGWVTLKSRPATERILPPPECPLWVIADIPPRYPNR